MEITPRSEMKITERIIEYEDALALARDGGEKFIIMNVLPLDSLMVVKKADAAGYMVKMWLGRIDNMDRLLFEYRNA